MVEGKEGSPSSVLEEPETIPFLSDIAKNATDFLNLPGIISPLLTELGVRIEIITDDMAASEGLKTLVNGENGEKELFVKPVQVNELGSGGKLVFSCAFFALSTMAFALLN